MGGSPDVVKYLIEEQHCLKDEDNITIQTLLFLVCEMGQLDVAKYLIEIQPTEILTV